MFRLSRKALYAVEAAGCDGQINEDTIMVEPMTGSTEIFLRLYVLLRVPS